MILSPRRQNQSLDAAERPRLVHITTVAPSLRFFRGQIGYLKSRGFGVAAISSHDPVLQQIATSEQIEVHPVRMARRIALWRDVVSLVQLWKLLRAMRPDIVHSHTPKAGLLGTIAARLAGVPVVAVSVFGLPQMTRTGLMRRLLNFTTRLSCRLADWVWCDSHSMGDYLVQHDLCSADKIGVLGQGSVNGIDVEVFSPTLFPVSARHELRARYGIPAEALVLGFVGRIVADKGLHELASAWRALRDRHPTLHLLLVGPFESSDPLLAEDEGLLRTDERIHLAGMQDDVARHLSAMDVFVSPSYREGFGIANIEASAMGLPVVSTRIPGCVDAVEDGVTGTLVPVRDGQALAAAIDSYLKNPELRGRHGAAGRARVVRCFQPEAIWEALEQKYLDLVGHVASDPKNVATVPPADVVV